MAATTSLAEQGNPQVLDLPEVLAPGQGVPTRSEKQHEPVLRRQMPELDSIRGIAILAVVIYHGFYWQLDLASFTPWQSILLTLTWPGRLGVNLFFVLSGFLITGLLLDSKSKPDYYKRFYVRRALRILPAYLGILFVLAATRYAPASFLGLSLAYLSNLTPLFGVAIAYPVLWSLAVEEHFYFVWPAVVRRFSRHALLALSVGVILISPVLRFLNWHVAEGFEFNDYTWNSLDGMACGAVVALLLRIWGQDRRRLFQLTLGFLAAAALLSPFAIQSRQTALGAAMQVVPWHCFFAGMLGALLLIGTTGRKSLVQSPFLRFFGYISYGLYLVHVLAFNLFDYLIEWSGFSGLLLRFVCSAGAATLIAWLSRRYFEDRFLKMNPLRSAPVPSRGLPAERDLSSHTA
jgi:peptidoglycan/LPS O-acetylase OafA/YrhL